MITRKRRLGDFGEEIAVNFLRKKGYRILERNFRRKWGEIDIVAKKKKELVFVEVKTLQQNQSLSAEESITYFKKKKLIKSAKLYLLEKKLVPDIPWQIDVIALELDYDVKVAHLKHYQNAIFES